MPNAVELFLSQLDDPKFEMPDFQKMLERDEIRAVGFYCMVSLASLEFDRIRSIRVVDSVKSQVMKEWLDASDRFVPNWAELFTAMVDLDDEYKRIQHQLDIEIEVKASRYEPRW